MIGRRSFLFGLGATLAAPAVIRTPGLLMPIKRIKPLTLIAWKEVTISYEISEEDLVQVHSAFSFTEEPLRIRMPFKPGSDSANRLMQNLVGRQILSDGAAIGKRELGPL